MKMKQLKGGITAISGILTAGVHCGIKAEKKDLALIYSKTPAIATALFTTNKLKSASLIVTQEHLKTSKNIHAIIINSGNANTCTGRQGLEDAKNIAQITAQKLKVPVETVLVASTGVIGEFLPMDKIEKGIDEVVKSLSTKGDDAAWAILTTDTKPKEIAIEFELSKRIKTRIGGIAKGAGMISPNLATMLVFMATDVVISRQLLKKALTTSVNKSFNLITIDGDRSPADMVILLSNNLAGNEEIVSPYCEDFKNFQHALNWVCLNLAKKIVEDGEGITKLLKISVKGAKTLKDAKVVAMSVAKSHLVKCAFYGEDPNWGRIITACGYADVPINPNLIDIFFEQELIVKNGQKVEFDLYRVKNILNQKEISVTIDLKQGRQEVIVLTSDLSPENINLNAHYTT